MIKEKKSKTTEPKLSGAAPRHNKGKPQLAHVPLSMKVAMAQVLEHGATKYGWNNWRRGYSWVDTASSAMRHLDRWVDPSWSDRDCESKLSHLYHALANIAFLIEYEMYELGDDDRVKTQKGLNHV